MAPRAERLEQPTAELLRRAQSAPRAVVVLLGNGLDATTVAKLRHISRKTLYQDRRQARRVLEPVIPAALRWVYTETRRPARPEEAE